MTQIHVEQNQSIESIPLGVKERKKTYFRLFSTCQFLVSWCLRIIIGKGGSAKGSFHALTQSFFFLTGKALFMTFVWSAPCKNFNPTLHQLIWNLSLVQSISVKFKVTRCVRDHLILSISKRHFGTCSFDLQCICVKCERLNIFCDLWHSVHICRMNRAQNALLKMADLSWDFLWQHF